MRTTSIPARAETRPMPAPIMPAPSTPTFLTSSLGTPAGRRAPRSAAVLLMKVVRIIFRATGSVSSFAKYLDSIEIGRAHVCTPVTNAHLVCRILLETKKQLHLIYINTQQAHRQYS